MAGEITEHGIREAVDDVMFDNYFSKELEEAKKAPTPYVPKKVLQFQLGLFGAGESQSEQQKAVVGIRPILIEQLSAVKNITEDEARLAAKKTFEWAAKNSRQVNETLEKTKSITDNITKVHTNELRADISRQIQDVRKEYFTEQKKASH